MDWSLVNNLNRKKVVPYRDWVSSAPVMATGALLIIVSLAVGIDLHAAGATLPLVAGCLLPGPVTVVVMMIAMVRRGTEDGALESVPPRKRTVIESVSLEPPFRPPDRR